MKIKRKTLMLILAAVGTFAGIILDETVIYLGVILLLFWVALESRLDMKRLKLQLHKFRDPKIWIAFVGALLPVLNWLFKWDLPVEKLVVLFAAVMGLFFKADNNKIEKENNQFIEDIAKKAREYDELEEAAKEEIDE